MILRTRGLTSVSLRDMMAVGISETQCFDAALLWRCAACPYIKTLTTLTYRGDRSTSIYNAKDEFIITKKIPRKKILMEKVYHIYAKEECLYNNLSEVQFNKTWRTLKGMVGLMQTDYQLEDLSYEECNRTNGVRAVSSTEPDGSDSY